jgi:hypothetical protein
LLFVRARWRRRGVGWSGAGELRARVERLMILGSPGSVRWDADWTVSLLVGWSADGSLQDGWNPGLVVEYHGGIWMAGS